MLTFYVNLNASHRSALYILNPFFGAWRCNNNLLLLCDIHLFPYSKKPLTCGSPFGTFTFLLVTNTLLEKRNNGTVAVCTENCFLFNKWPAGRRYSFSTCTFRAQLAFSDPTPHPKLAYPVDSWSNYGSGYTIVSIPEEGTVYRTIPTYLECTLKTYTYNATLLDSYVLLLWFL